MGNLGKKAFITGITGQDGSYLTEFLLEKGYQIYGLVRYSSVCNTQRINHLLNNPEYSNRIKLFYGDLTDGVNLINPIKEVIPDEIYNLASQSHVGISYDSSEYTANANGLGTLRLLEIIKSLDLDKHTKFYQALTSDIFGNTNISPQNEDTPFHPASPYACSKLYAYWTTRSFREKFDIFAVNGISYAHESPRRGENFVTRKITKAAARIKFGLQNKLYLGNLDTQRDWGHAKDYVRAMWLMLQQDIPDDYVLSTEKTLSIRDFCIKVFEKSGINLCFEGNGLEEKGIDSKTGNILIEVNKDFYRPSEKVLIVGDSSKAKRFLGWQPEYTIDQLIFEMVEEDLKNAYNEKQGSLNDNLYQRQ